MKDKARLKVSEPFCQRHHLIFLIIEASDQRHTEDNIRAAAQQVLQVGLDEPVTDTGLLLVKVRIMTFDIIQEKVRVTDDAFQDGPIPQTAGIDDGV